jgi:hypothetical protein
MLANDVGCDTALFAASAQAQRQPTDPEPDEIPGAPLSPRWLDRLQVVIVKHELGAREPGLALAGQFVRIVTDLGLLELFHDGG